MTERPPRKPRWYERPRVREFGFQVAVNVTSGLLIVVILYLGAAATGVIQDQPEKATRAALLVLGVSLALASLMLSGRLAGGRLEDDRSRQSQSKE